MQMGAAVPVKAYAFDDTSELLKILQDTGQTRRGKSYGFIKDGI
jgi:hypothetical protein